MKRLSKSQNRAPTSPLVAGTKSVYSEVQIGVESVVLISDTSPNFDKHWSRDEAKYCHGCHVSPSSDFSKTQVLARGDKAYLIVTYATWKG